MKTAKQLRAEHAALSDKVQAIVDSAEAAERELDATEKAEVDKALGTKDTPGTLATLRADIERAEKLEAEAAERAKLSNATTNINLTSGNQATVVNVKKAYRPAALRAFSGPTAEADAEKTGRYLFAVLAGHKQSIDWCRSHIEPQFLAAHGENSNELGGFLVFPEMERTIIDLREQYGVFRREAKVSPMASDTKVIPRRASGLTAYFTNEAGSLTESQKGWEQVQMVAKKIYCLTRYSSELAEDAIISIADDLVSEIAYAFAKKEDECGFLGDGTSTYGAIVGLENALNAGSIYTATGHTTFSALTFADFETILGRVPTYVRNVKWYISKAGYYASMRRLADSLSGNSIPDILGGQPLRFMGHDVVISQTLPSALTSTTATTALYCGDLAMAATLGDRRGITIKRSEEAYYSTDEIGIRGTQRFDISVHEKGTATVAGPIQKLLFG